MNASNLHDTSAELSALALALLRPEDAFGADISAHHFHDQMARRAWAAMEGVWGMGERPTPAHLTDDGARAVLEGVADAGVMPIGVEILSGRLEAARIRREVVATADKLQRMALDGAEPEHLEAEMSRLRWGKGKRYVPSLASEAEDVIADIEWRMGNPGQVRGYRVGLKEWEETLDGIKTGFHIIAARPGEGKTAIMGQMASHLALHGAGAAYMSLEMPAKQMRSRLLAGLAEVPVGGYMERPYTTGEMDRLKGGMAQLTRMTSLHIYDHSCDGINDWETMRRVARKARERGELDILFIDYLQLIRLSSAKDNRQAELSQISMDIKRLAGELDIPIVAAAQLKRPEIQHTKRRPAPGLESLKETGSFEQDADSVTAIHDDGEVCKLMILKNRHGSIKDIEVQFIREQTRFRELNALDRAKKLGSH
jgi:replicative DNA helicase